MSETEEQILVLAREVEDTFPGATTEVGTFDSGAVTLDVRLGDRVLVMAYLPSAGWFGVDELTGDEGLDHAYRYGSPDLEGARESLLSLLGTP